MNIELPKKNSDPNQLDIFEDQPVKSEQSKQVEEKDSRGRTQEDILRYSRVYDPDKIRLIFKSGEFYIDGEPADKWTASRNELDKKVPYYRGQD